VSPQDVSALLRESPLIAIILGLIVALLWVVQRARGVSTQNRALIELLLRLKSAGVKMPDGVEDVLKRYTDSW
jgi:hypothetical protein